LSQLTDCVDINIFVEMSNPEALPFATTLYVRDHCLCLASQRAARALARRFDEALRPVGLSSGQFSLLMSLNRPEPPTMGSVAALLAMDRTTLTANLKPLQRRGLLSVEADSGDRRTRRLALTDAGMTALEAAVPIWRSTHEGAEQLISAADAGTLRSSLAALS